jgi:hypothetical protein
MIPFMSINFLLMLFWEVFQPAWPGLHSYLDGCLRSENDNYCVVSVTLTSFCNALEYWFLPCSSRFRTLICLVDAVPKPLEVGQFRWCHLRSCFSYFEVVTFFINSSLSNVLELPFKFYS